MTPTFLIYPHGLFDVGTVLLPALMTLAQTSFRVDVAVIEEPCFFHDKEFRPCKVHKLRIAFIRATCKLYHAALVSNNSDLLNNVSYVPYERASSFYKTLATQSRECYTWSLHDDTLRGKLDALGIGQTLHELESQMFLLSAEDVARWAAARVDSSSASKTKHQVAFAHFYKFAKGCVLERTHPLMNEKSHDVDNRKAWPRDKAFPPSYQDETCVGIQELRDRAVQDAVRFAESSFADHVGSPSNLSKLALTHAEAFCYMQKFISIRLSDFGPYQDALHPDEIELAHSNLAYLLNCGLLLPGDVLKACLQHRGGAKKDRMWFQSLEAFIRQLVGWREYMRAIYVVEGSALSALFSPGGGTVRARAHMYSRAPSKSWYAATSGIDVLDNEIRKCMQWGYAHHTVRLMVFLCLMLLHELSPGQILRWFMDVVAIDAYEWVMMSNISAMSYMPIRSPAANVTRYYMRKPYYCSSNYAKVMSGSRYMRDRKWDKLFYDFLERHEHEFEGGARAYLRNIQHKTSHKVSWKDFRKVASLNGVLSNRLR